MKVCDLLVMPLKVLPAVASRGRPHTFARRGSPFPVPYQTARGLLPADEVGGHAACDFRLLAALVIGAEQEAVQVKRNQREDFLAGFSLNASSDAFLTFNPCVNHSSCAIRKQLDAVT